MTGFLFWFLMATAALAPLPLASNRPGPAGLLAFAVGIQLALLALGALASPSFMRVSWRRYAWAMLGFAVLVAWFVVQQSGATPSAWHDPIWTDASKILGVPLRGAMTLDPDAARQTLMHLVTYAGVFFLAMQLCRDRARASAAIWCTVVIGLAYSIYGLIVYFHGNDTILWFGKYAYRQSLTSTFVNRNNFGTYAGMALIATIGLLFTESEESRRYGVFSRAGFVHFMNTLDFRVFMLFGFAIVIASALFLTSSRGAAAGTVAGIVVLAVAERFAKRRKGGEGRLWVSLGSLAAFVALLLVFSGDRLIGRVNESVGSAGRGVVYSITMRAIADHPWIGTGLGSFAEAFSRYRDARLDSSDFFFDKAHNTYLELALEIGLPAMILLLAILGGIVAASTRGVVVRRRDFMFSSIGLGVTTLVALHSLVDFSLQMPAVSVAYALILGVSFAQAYPTQEREAVRAARRPMRVEG